MVIHFKKFSGFRTFLSWYTHYIEPVKNYTYKPPRPGWLSNDTVIQLGEAFIWDIRCKLRETHHLEPRFRTRVNLIERVEWKVNLLGTDEHLSDVRVVIYRRDNWDARTPHTGLGLGRQQKHGNLFRETPLLERLEIRVHLTLVEGGTPKINVHFHD